MLLGVRMDLKRFFEFEYLDARDEARNFRVGANGANTRIAGSNVSSRRLAFSAKAHCQDSSKQLKKRRNVVK
jgi:hypothetical protein